MYAAMNEPLTIFSCPKPFEGEFERIQNNAIASWKAIGANVVLIDTARTNEFGTPLLDDVFRLGEFYSQTRLVAYVNTDIILFDDFMQAAMVCDNHLPHFMLSGERFNFKYGLAGIDSCREVAHEIRQHESEYGEWIGKQAADYFVYRKGDLGALPPFAIGRYRTDNWLLWRALDQRLELVDATEAVLALHQPHPMHHNPAEHGLEYNDWLVSQNGGTLGRLTDANWVMDADFQLHERVKA